MWSRSVLNEEILQGWERCETNTGLFYYVNHETEVTQWDHPLLVRILHDLGEMDMIKYAAYRTAMKMRLLQKQLRLDLVDVHVVSCALERVVAAAGRRDDVAAGVVDGATLLALLEAVFETSRRRSVSAAAARLRPAASAEVLLGLLLRLYDRNRRGYVRTSAVQVALAMLCSTRLTEKYRYIFTCLCGADNHINRETMTRFLQDVVKFPELLHESSAFGGTNVGPAVEHCFSLCWNPIGVTEDEFVNWMLREPQTIVWLPTMHRVAAAESVKHEAKCNSCKMFPIIGIRYRCLRCFNYDLCQDCFLMGRVSKKHKTHHPIQEYCLAPSVKEDTKAMLRTIRYNLSKKRRRKKKLRYVPIVTTQPPYQHEISDEEPAKLKCGEVTCPPSEGRPAGERASKCLQTDLFQMATVEPDDSGIGRYELQAAICHLEEENRQLLLELEQPRSEACASQRSSTGSTGGSRSEASTAEVEWLMDENERLTTEQTTLRDDNTRLQRQLRRLRETPSTQVNQGDVSAVPEGLPAPPPVSRPPPPSYHTPLQSAPPPAWPRPPADASSHVEPSPPPVPTPGERQPPAWGGRTGSRAQDSGSSEGEEESGGSPEEALRTRFLPPAGSDSELGELDALLERFERAYPLDATHDKSDDAEASRCEMLRAAARMGDAFSLFVGNVASTNDSASPRETEEDQQNDDAVQVAPPVGRADRGGYHGYISDDSEI